MSPADDLLAELRELVAGSESDVTLVRFCREVGVSPGTVARFWGGWTQLRLAARLTPRAVPRRSGADVRRLRRRRRVRQLRFACSCLLWGVVGWNIAVWSGGRHAGNHSPAPVVAQASSVESARRVPFSPRIVRSVAATERLRSLMLPARREVRVPSGSSNLQGRYWMSHREGQRMASAELRPTFIGCAGWTIPKPFADRVPAEGTHLERYAAVLPAVEINSSFYRPHRPATYAKWRDSTPAGFRFSVKMPKAMTHERRLEVEEDPLDEFCEQVAGLGDKLGCLLVQLPPSLQFDPDIAADFFAALRERTPVMIACEPRHATWVESDAEKLLRRHHIVRVAADPAKVAAAAEPGGSTDGVYYRLHGSPRMYYSAYEADYLQRLAEQIRQHVAADKPTWCIFDNTALGAAFDNTLTVQAAVNRR